MSIKPAYTLLFLLATGLLIAGLGELLPKEGVAVSEDLTLQFPRVSEWLIQEKEEIVEPEFQEVEDLLESYTLEVDSLAIQDSLKKAAALRRQQLLKIQFHNNDKTPLHELFVALEKVRSGGKLRVMHYGDSQIEGDRISGFIRNELQKEFGGRGPGLVQAFEVIPTIAIEQSSSENWYRKAVYGPKDTTVTHDRYGLLAHFSSFSVDSARVDSAADAWLEFKPSRLTYSRAKQFSKAVMYYGNAHPFTLHTYVNDSLVKSELVNPAAGKGKKTIAFGSTPESMRLEFFGEHAPDIYGLSFENNTGVVLDNIPLRGSSGTIFKKINKDQLTHQYADLNIELFLLQFGGNTVPYLDDQKAVDRYGSWFKSQITYLQSIVPNASIIVIGPSDMAHKVKDKFVTRPYLEEVRDALKQAAFETNCGFWDIYEVMGGRNSMKTWVEADPALAGNDYTHFTPKGARKIAELFSKTFWEEYEAWKTDNESLK